MGSGVAALVAVMLTVTPTNGGFLSTPQITINNQPGDQFDPHVDQNIAAYSNAVDLGTTILQEIRYYNFATGQDIGVPNGLSDGGVANDLLSDVDQGRIVFTRLLGQGAGTAIMLHDSATQTTTELAPAPGTTRIGVAIGAQTVAFADFSVGNGTGEIMVLDLTTSTLTQLTNDLVSDATPAVSPDGNVVTWEHCVGSNCDIYRASRSGSTWLTKPMSSSLLDEHSPDTNGSQVVFERDDLTGPTGTNVVLVPVAGGAETILEIPGEQYNPSIRGQIVAFESRAVGALTSDIFLVDLATNRMFQITNTPSFTESLNDVTVLPTGEIRLVWQALDEAVPTVGNIYGATFTLPPVASPPDAGTPPVCLNRSVTVEATRFYSPPHVTDGHATFSPPMAFAIPQVVPVIAGNAGNKHVTLTIDLGTKTIQCDYQSGSHQEHPTSAAQLALASRYLLTACKEVTRCGGHGHDGEDDDDDDGEGNEGGSHGHHSGPSYGAGTVVTARAVTLHVENGDTHQPLTRVRLVLGEVCGGTSSVSSPLEAGNAPLDAPQAAGCSSSGVSLAPFFAAFAFLALMLRRPASIRLVARREQRRLPR